MAVGIATVAGCATVIACPVMLIVLILAAAFALALVVVLAAALIAGNIARSMAESRPTGSAVGGGDDAAVAVGNYVTINGNLIRYQEDGNALVAWWVEETTVHGSSTSGEGAGGSAPFPFTDPRDNLVPDACKLIAADEPATKG